MRGGSSKRNACGSKDDVDDSEESHFVDEGGTDKKKDASIAAVFEG